MKFLGIIPARYASVRFPGKPLADLGGKPLIQRVCETAGNFLDHVVIATDDERIMDAVERFGGEVLMTSDRHRSGTDRCAEAAAVMNRKGYDFDAVINIQGDEPFIEKDQFELLMNAFSDPVVEIATLAGPIRDQNELFNPNVVKVVRRKDGNALYFSRSPIPFIRQYEKNDWLKHYDFLHHLGIYAYRYNTLLEITRLTPSSLELAESLEQNRWLENGRNIRVCFTEKVNPGIDTPEDLERARSMISAKE